MRPHLYEMETKLIITTHLYHSPCGDLLLGSSYDRLCLCDWMIDRRRERIDRHLCTSLNAVMRQGTSPVIEKAIRQLDGYFAGTRTTFDLPLLFVGTDFRKAVWKQLLTIPYGHTVSYSQMASSMGCPASVRAVANANAANAISIFVPCHRVTGADGTLTGYAGGLPAKHFLLTLESPAPLTLF